MLGEAAKLDGCSGLPDRRYRLLAVPRPHGCRGGVYGRGMELVQGQVRGWYLGREIVFLGRYRASAARIRYPESRVVHIVPLERVVLARVTGREAPAADAA